MNSQQTINNSKVVYRVGDIVSVTSDPYAVVGMARGWKHALVVEAYQQNSTNGFRRLGVMNMENLGSGVIVTISNEYVKLVEPSHWSPGLLQGAIAMTDKQAEVDLEEYMRRRENMTLGELLRDLPHE